MDDNNGVNLKNVGNFICGQENVFDHNNMSNNVLI